MPRCLRDMDTFQQAIEAFLLLQCHHDLEEEEEKEEVLQLCITSMMNFPPWDTLEKAGEDSIVQIRYQRTFEAVFATLKALLEWHVQPGNLLSILKNLMGLLESPQTHQRERAARAIAQLLQISQNQAPAAMRFPGSVKGRMAALLFVCCTEEQAALRHWGKAALSCLLWREFRPKIESDSRAFVAALEREETWLPSSTFEETALTITEHLPERDLAPFLFTLLDRMRHQGPEGPFGWSEMLPLAIERRCGGLSFWTNQLLPALNAILSHSNVAEMKQVAKRAVSILVKAEPRRVAKRPLATRQDVREMQDELATLATDTSISPQILTAPLGGIPKQVPKRSGAAGTPPPLPPAIPAATWDFVAVAEARETLEGTEATLFLYSSLSIAGASSQEEEAGMAVRALHQVLLLGGCEDHLQATTEGSHGGDLLSHASERKAGFAHLGRDVAHYSPETFPRNCLVDLLPLLYSSEEAQRANYTAFFAEFLESPNLYPGDRKLMKELYKAMWSAVADTEMAVKSYGLRGLGRVINFLPKKIAKHKEAILKVFMDSLSDPSHSIIRQEGMTGILRVLPHLGALKTSTGVQLAMQARGFFDDEDPFMRRGALETLGQLSRIFPRKNAVFSLEVEKSLASLLIHLQDCDPAVAEASKDTLWQCASFIRFKPVRNHILQHLKTGEPGTMASFLEETCRLLVQDCPGQLDRKSAVRVAAAHQVIGHLMQ